MDASEIERAAKAELAAEHHRAAINKAKVRILKKRQERADLLQMFPLSVVIGICLGFLAGLPLAWLVTVLPHA